MKNGLNEEEVWPNELPGLWSSRDCEGKEGRRGKPLRKKGPQPCPKCASFSSLQRQWHRRHLGKAWPPLSVPKRREAEHQVCVDPEKFYWPSCYSLRYFYICIDFFADSMLEQGNEYYVLVTLCSVSGYIIQSNNQVK